ncbi:MAG: hypothetical protein RLZZ481_836 [Pseudomonadota bacterium]
MQKPSKDWLEAEYTHSRRTCNDIAKQLGVDPKTVWAWMKSYGLETRKRGGASSPGSFKKGDSIWTGKTHSESTKQKIRDARLKDGHVPYLKNGVHWMKGKSKEDHPMWKGGVTPERQEVYSSFEWVDAVKKVWSRDGATCQKCGAKHNTETNRGTFHIHHIVSFAVKELRTEPNNLILLCKPCHIWVHSNQNTQKLFIKESK